VDALAKRRGMAREMFINLVCALASSGARDSCRAQAAIIDRSDSIVVPNAEEYLSRRRAS